MKEQKVVKAKIFNPDNDEFLSDISLRIELITPSDPNKKPEYRVLGRIEKTCEEAYEKDLILEINSSLRGRAKFTIYGIPGLYTDYKIYLDLHDWGNIEWFQNL